MGFEFSSPLSGIRSHNVRRVDGHASEWVHGYQHDPGIGINLFLRVPQPDIVQYSGSALKATHSCKYDKLAKSSIPSRIGGFFRCGKSANLVFSKCSIGCDQVMDLSLHFQIIVTVESVIVFCSRVPTIQPSFSSVNHALTSFA